MKNTDTAAILAIGWLRTKLQEPSRSLTEEVVREGIELAMADGIASPPFAMAQLADIILTVSANVLRAAAHQSGYDVDAYVANLDEQFGVDARFREITADSEAPDEP
jgi:acid phosphatase family membrane protein YuiD